MDENHSPPPSEAMTDITELRDVLDREIEGRKKRKREDDDEQLYGFSSPLNKYLESQDGMEIDDQRSNTPEAGNNPSHRGTSLLMSTNPVVAEPWNSLNFDAPSNGAGEALVPKRYLAPLSPRQGQEASRLVTAPVVHSDYLLRPTFSHHSKPILQQSDRETATPPQNRTPPVSKLSPKVVMERFFRICRTRGSHNAEDHIPERLSSQEDQTDEVKRLMALQPKETQYVGDVMSRILIDSRIVREPWKVVVGFFNERWKGMEEHLLIYWQNDTTNQIALAAEHIKYIRSPDDSLKIVLWANNEDQAPGYGTFLPGGAMKAPL